MGDPEMARKSWFRRYPEDLRGDWEEIKEETMRAALRAKFFQNKYLRPKLSVFPS